MNKTLIVVGGGAAGIFCAVNAAGMNTGLDVVLLEKQQKLMGKVKVSGGGRCNVTHACFEVQDLVKHYPRGQNFLKKSFYLFSPKDTVRWFEERGVQLKTELDGRMFPVTDSSQTIIDCLMREASQKNVKLVLGCGVQKMERGEGNKWLVSTDNGLFVADYVCVATGGYPNLEKFNWLSALGLEIESPVPSLFTFNLPNHSITGLMGVSVAGVKVRVMGSKLESSGPLLITHWGLSGPAVLKLSAFGARELANKGYACDIMVNWWGQGNEEQLKEAWGQLRLDYASRQIGGKNPFSLPNRLWQFLLANIGIAEETRWAELTAPLQNKLIRLLTGHEFKIAGKTTFKEEFVTCGGIKLSEINPLTMESKRFAGLYFAGEVMDIDGVTGGFNFQHAWTSGWVAAKAIAG